MQEFYRMKTKPYILGGLFLLSGHPRAFLRRVEKPIPQGLVEFRRREQIQRLMKLFYGTVIQEEKANSESFEL
jgi:hypothetical protein